MARIREEDYAYATARIRAIEAKLINRSKLERLFDAQAPSEAMKLLLESGYASNSHDNYKDESDKLESLFSSELKKIYDLLFEILPNPTVVDLFKRRYDYLNAKLILKAEFLNVDVFKSLSPMGTIEPSKLIKLITDRKLSALPEVFEKAILRCMETFNETGDPQTIDLMLDRACFENMANDAADFGEPYIIELVERMTNAANIRILVRGSLLSMPAEFISKALVNGGSIPEKTLVEYAGRSIEQFFDAIRYFGLSELAGELSKAVKSQSAISEVEKILDDYVMKFIQQSRYVAMGIEPAIAYLFYKETEIKNARLIIAGQINRIPQETIKERLRLGYA